MESEVPWVSLLIVREPIAGLYTSGDQIRSGADAVRILGQTAVPRHAVTEHMVAVFLDTRHQLRALHVLSKGGMDSATVDPRALFLAALAAGASAMILAHNHPSGDPTPSAEDRKVTDRIRKCGELLAIPLLDHLILGSERYYSFAEENVYRYETPTS